jgi:hypothetical protein
LLRFATKIGEKKKKKQSHCYTTAFSAFAEAVKTADENRFRIELWCGQSKGIKISTKTMPL